MAWDVVQDVGIAVACSLFAVLGGLILSVWGWPLSYSEEELKARAAAGDERTSRRFEILTVLNTHTLVGLFL